MIITHKQDKIDACTVYEIHCEVDDLEKHVTQLIQKVSDSSWINSIENSLKQRAATISFQRTVKSLTKALKEYEDKPKDAGEYIVSVSALKALKSLGHKEIPLSEFWKEQVSGNPGFDFHTITPDASYLFGEAKYLSGKTAAGSALKQIHRFIYERLQDEVDAAFLQDTGSSKDHFYPAQKFEQGIRVFAAAFSVKSKNIDTTFKNARKRDEIKDLKTFPELYLIAVSY